MPSRRSLLVGDVVVERHRLDPERLAELAHAERLEPARVGEGDGGAQHPLPAQRAAGRDRCRLDDVIHVSSSGPLTGVVGKRRPYGVSLTF